MMNVSVSSPQRASTTAQPSGGPSSLTSQLKSSDSNAASEVPKVSSPTVAASVKQQEPFEKVAPPSRSNVPPVKDSVKVTFSQQQPVVEKSVYSKPKVEAPKVEIQKAEAPKVEIQKAEAPKVDIPKVDIPKVEIQKVEVRKVEPQEVEQKEVISVEEPKVVQASSETTQAPVVEQSELTEERLPQAAPIDSVEVEIVERPQAETIERSDVAEIEQSRVQAEIQPQVQTQVQPQAQPSVRAEVIELAQPPQPRSIERPAPQQPALQRPEPNDALQQQNSSSSLDLSDVEQPQFESTTGPDGNRYAVVGEVSVSYSGFTDPKKQPEEAEQVQRAASAPAQSSAQDRAVTRDASQKLSAARQDIIQETREQQGSQGAVQSNVPSSPQGNVQSNIPSSPQQSVQSNLPSSPQQSVQSNLPSSPQQSVQSNLPSSPQQSVQSNLPSSPQQSVQSNTQTNNVKPEVTLPEVATPKVTTPVSSSVSSSFDAIQPQAKPEVSIQERFQSANPAQDVRPPQEPQSAAQAKPDAIRKDGIETAQKLFDQQKKVMDALNSNRLEGNQRTGGTNSVSASGVTESSFALNTLTGQTRSQASTTQADAQARVQTQAESSTQSQTRIQEQIQAQVQVQAQSSLANSSQAAAVQNNGQEVARQETQSQDTDRPTAEERVEAQNERRRVDTEETGIEVDEQAAAQTIERVSVLINQDAQFQQDVAIAAGQTGLLQQALRSIDAREAQAQAPGGVFTALV